MKFRLFALSLLGLLLALPAMAQIPGGSSIAINITPVTGGTNTNCLNITNGKVGQAACGGSATITAGSTATSGFSSGNILASNGTVVGALTLVHDTIFGNFTSGTTAPSGNAIPVCTSGQSLQYTAGSGFSCVTAVLFIGTTGTTTVGYGTTTPSGSGALGTPTNGSTTTLVCGNGQYQNLTNNVAGLTIAAPTGYCPILLTITNGASAGTITWSGFSGSKHGDAFTTTNTSVFLVSILPTATTGSPAYSAFAQQ